MLRHRRLTAKVAAIATGLVCVVSHPTFAVSAATGPGPAFQPPPAQTEPPQLRATTRVAPPAARATRTAAEHRLTVATLDRGGARPSEYQPIVLVADLETGELHRPEAVDGQVTAVLPAGRYAVWAGVPTGPADRAEPSTTLAAAPDVTLDRDVTVEFDARHGRRVTPVVDRPGAVSNGAETLGIYQTVAGETQYASASTTAGAELFALPTTATVAGFGFFQMATLAEPEIQLTAVHPDRYPVRSEYIDGTYSPRLVGDQTLVAVDGGRGTPEDLARADARGRLVLLTLDRPGEIDAVAERVADVARAGGKAVQLTTHHRGSIDGPLALPTMVTDDPAALRFAAAARAGKVQVRLHGLAGSPYQYNLVDAVDGRIPAGPPRIGDRDLAAVQTRYVAQGVGGAIGTTYTSPRLPISIWTSPTRIAIPSRRTEYFSTGGLPGVSEPLTWRHEMRHESSGDGSLPWGGPQSGDRGPYGPGRYAEDWNAGPIGPCLRLGGESGSLAWFTDTLLYFDSPTTCDSAPGHRGDAVSFGGDTGSTRIVRDGVEIAASKEPGQQFFEDVPKAAGDYEAHVDITRSAPWTTLATRVLTTWAFHWADPDQQPPMLAVRHATAVDDQGRAPRSHELRVRVERTSGAAAGISTTGTPTVGVSYDDGGTWIPVALRPTADGWTTTLAAPLGARYVSLRSSAADATGSRVSHEVIRAYALR